MTKRCVAVVVVLMFGMSACGDDDDQRGGIEVATELADTWGTGWNTNDANAVASVFTAEGVYSSFNGQDYVGTAENANHVEVMGDQVTDLVRVGDLSATPQETYTWEVEADLAGVRHRGTLEMELEGDLVGRLTWLVDPVPIN